MSGDNVSLRGSRWVSAPNAQVIFHARQRAAGINLRFTPDARIRLIRALKMTVLFMWLLLDMLESEIGSEINEGRHCVKNLTPRYGK